MTSLSLDRWPLEVTITPTQSSFFAGEELKCLITFTNHNVPVPASQPLPSTSRFPDYDGTSNDARRIVSTAAPAAPPASGHSKSRSFDIRNPLRPDAAKSNGSEGHAHEDAVLYDLNGQPLPGRKKLIGRNANLLAEQKAQTPVRDIPRGHAKSASMAVFSSPRDTPPHHLTEDKSTVGLGRPSHPPSNQLEVPSRDPSAAWSTIREFARLPPRSLISDLTTSPYNTSQLASCFSPFRLTINTKAFSPNSKRPSSLS